MPKQDTPTSRPDISRCPGCGGPADNGNDREVPPNPYHCTRCEAAGVVLDPVDDDEPARAPLVNEIVDALMETLDRRRVGDVARERDRCRAALDDLVAASRWVLDHVEEGYDGCRSCGGTEDHLPDTPCGNLSRSAGDARSALTPPKEPTDG